jgi:hypothetical protein
MSIPAQIASQALLPGPLRPALVPFTPGFALPAAGDALVLRSSAGALTAFPPSPFAAGDIPCICVADGKSGQLVAVALPGDFAWLNLGPGFPGVTPGKLLGYQVMQTIPNVLTTGQTAGALMLVLQVALIGNVVYAFGEVGPMSPGSVWTPDGSAPSPSAPAVTTLLMGATFALPTRDGMLDATVTNTMFLDANGRWVLNMSFSPTGTQASSTAQVATNLPAGFTGPRTGIIPLPVVPSHNAVGSYASFSVYYDGGAGDIKLKVFQGSIDSSFVFSVSAFLS